MSELGEILLTGCYDAAGRVRYLTVTHADPEIAMSHELFRYLLMDRTPCDGVELTPGPGGGYHGAILKIRAVNGTWVYRVEEFLDHQRGWRLRWPD